MNDINLPQHFRYIIPIIEALKEMGGSGKPSEVTDKIIEMLNISEEELQKTIKSGASKVINQIHWARLFLVKTAYLDSSKRGVWSLTEKGYDANLSKDFLINLYDLRKKMMKEYQKEYKNKKPLSLPEDEDFTDPDADEKPDVGSHRLELLDKLKSLPPDGFERICQRVLRESGFEQVVVTGKSGDGGIDGIGIIKVNPEFPYVSFRVLFQCKRYQGSVTATQVRDFRGAMQGRADKGIIITTGNFTLDAKRESNRDGVIPIDLVDGQKLVDMFETLELGLIPKKIYSLDNSFFEQFEAKL